MLEEEEEVASRSWNHMAKKGVHTYHLSVISCPGPFCGVVIIRWELLIFLCEMSCMLLQGHKLLRLGARYQLGASNSWDTMAHPFSTIVLESPYTWFLSGLPDYLASIHKSGSKSMWVEGSSPYLSLNQLLYVSWKWKLKSSNSIQENNNLWK
jgi:hypothetical protein